MRFTNLIGASLVACISSVSALELPEDHILYGSAGKPLPRAVVRRATTTSSASDSSCTNGPLTRSCWSPGYTVATDFDQKWPTTGKTVSYDFTITNTTCNPDGAQSRVCLLINNQMPGPTITANWGDTISVKVTNKMQNNGTGIHWHGIRQLNSNAMDGTNGLTECPIAPGQSKTYTFLATQFGTTWYHSHFTAQYGDGVVGPIVINGPSSLNYDVDMGPIAISDWYYQTAIQVDYLTNVALQKAGPGPPGDNILINGKNKNAQGGGSYWKGNFTPGKKYKLRLVNIGVDNAVRVSLDNHTMQVITSDLVPVKPITASSVLLGVGQRYDVVITANQAVGNYWLRASVENACANSNNWKGLAIISYDGSNNNDPQSTSNVQDNGCNPPGQLTPWVPNNVGSEQDFKDQAKNLNVNIQLPGTTTNNQNIVVWGINMTAIDIQWNTPTLTYVMNKNTSYPQVANLVEIPNEGTWTYWIIQETAGGPASIPHPMHLHGHDFYILGTGTGTFNINTDPDNLQYTNPTRRDTAFLPGGGWIVIAFPADNPGAWLMHCHIAWHISQGLGVQFLEAKGSINLPGSQYQQECQAWSNYQNHMIYPQDDSGLKFARRRSAQF